MDGMFWISLISMALAGVSNIIDSIGSKKLRTISNALEKSLTKDQELRNKLIEAYNEKNSGLLNSLLMQSPIGSAYKTLKNDLNKAKTDYQKGIDTIDKRINKKSEMYSKASNLQMAPTAGLVVGESVKLNETNKLNTDYNDLVKGGIV